MATTLGELRDHHSAGRVALLLQGRSGRPCLEIAAVDDDAATGEVLELLRCGTSIT